MDNFNRLEDTILQFHFGIVLHENCYYYTVRDSLMEEVDAHRIKPIITNAVRDLSELKPDNAFKKIANLKNLVEAIAKYKNGTENIEDAFKQFGYFCNHNSIPIRKGYSKNNESNDLPAKFIVTPNLCRELDLEMWARTYIIDLMEIRLKQSIHGEVNEKISIYEDSKWVKSNGNSWDVRGPGELKYDTWLKIVDQDDYILNEPDANNLNKSNLKPLTHRVEALIYLYKVKAGIEPLLTTSEIKKKWPKKNRELAFNSLTKGYGNYFAPKRDELIVAMNALCEFPEIQRAISNDLDKPENN